MKSKGMILHNSYHTNDKRVCKCCGGLFPGGVVLSYEWNKREAFICCLCAKAIAQRW